MQSDSATLLEECLPEERQRRILERLGSEGRVLAAELARQFGASEDTIRRDLRELAAAGLCRRVYGGALPLSAASGPLVERARVMPAEKRRLGETVAGLLSMLAAGQTVFVDAGSTNLAAVRALPDDMRMTLVTNFPGVAAEAAGREGIEVVMIGGTVDKRTGGAFGARALRDVAELRPDVYLLGACALDAVAGVAVFGFEEAEFKRQLAAQARRVIGAVTSDKLGTGAPFSVGPARMFHDVVLEADAPDEQAAALLAIGVEVHRAASATPTTGNRA